MKRSSPGFTPRPREFKRSWANAIPATACLGVLGLFLYLTYRQGENSIVAIPDNLDSAISWYKMLKDSGTFWAPLHAKVPQIFNGLPRNSMVSSLSIFASFFMFFDPLPAYILTEAIARLTGYVGMFLLLRKHVLGDAQNLLSHFVALVFSLMPFMNALYLTVMGQPLLWYAFLNLRRSRSSIHSWLILVLFPFCSILAVGGFAIVLGMVGFVVWDWIQRRKLNFDLAGAVALVTLCYAIVEYRLIYQTFLDSGYVSDRSARPPAVLSYRDMPWEILTYFVRTWPVQFPLVVALPLCVAAPMIRLRGTKFVPANHLKILLSLLSVTVATGILAAVWQAGFLVPAKKTVTILNTFDWRRINFIEPALKYILFAVGLGFLTRVHFVGRFVAGVLLVLQLGFCFLRGIPSVGAALPARYWTTRYQRWQDQSPRFAKYYGEGLFREIRAYIGEPPENYRVGSIGFDPAISQYNGFYTLDGYVPDYPLSYKVEFRKIIAPALETHPRWRAFFDDWGSQVYLYSTLDDGPEHEKVGSGLNIRQFKVMGGRFLFSAWWIENPEETGLRFRRLFHSPGFAWRVYLYEVQ